MNKLSKTLLTFLFAAVAGQVLCQDFVYKPINPAFGGDTFNYNWLLSSAQAQDLTEDPDAPEFGNSRTTAESFAESLNRLLLNQISREIVTSQFGEEGFTDGTYELGDFQVDVATTLEGLSITVFDLCKVAQRRW